MTRLYPMLAALLALASLACATPPDARTQALQAEVNAYKLARQGQVDEAIAEYTRGIQLDPEIALLYHGRGVAFASTGDYPAALADLDRALQLDPDRAMALFERGRVYYATQQFDRALADLTSALDLSGGDPDVDVPAQRLLSSIRSGDAALNASR